VYKPDLCGTSTIIHLMKCARIWLQHLKHTYMPRYPHTQNHT